MTFPDLGLCELEGGTGRVDATTGGKVGGEHRRYVRYVWVDEDGESEREGEGGCIIVGSHF
jgi:hypothetical protein